MFIFFISNPTSFIKSVDSQQAQIMHSFVLFLVSTMASLGLILTSTIMASFDLSCVIPASK